MYWSIWALAGCGLHLNTCGAVRRLGWSERHHSAPTSTPPSFLFTSNSSKCWVAGHLTCALYPEPWPLSSEHNNHASKCAGWCTEEDLFRLMGGGEGGGWVHLVSGNYCITKAANMDMSGWDKLRFCCSIHLALWLCHGTSLYIELSVWTDTMERGMDENNTPMNPASAPLPTLITLTAEQRWPQPPVSPLLCRWPLKGESVPFFSEEKVFRAFPNEFFFFLVFLDQISFEVITC